MLLYVRLLNEGTEVARPTEAVELEDGLLRILATSDYDPNIEEWAFPPGSIVRAENKIVDENLYSLASAV